jgi:hypothetical protein
MAAEELQLDLEALACSAAHVAGQDADLATAHLSADTRVAAGSGLSGQLCGGAAH